MTLANCVTNKGKVGLVNSFKAEKAADRFREISDALIKAGESPNVAYAMAAQRTADEIKYAAAVTKHRLLDGIRVRQELTGMVAKQTTGKGLRALIRTTVDDLHFDAQSINKVVQKRIMDFLKENHVNLFGQMTNPVMFRDVLRALHGEPPSSPQVKALVEALQDAQNFLRTSLNKYGYAIPELENWGMAHTHNAARIGGVPEDQWVAEIIDQINWKAMTDETTGALFTSPPPRAFQDAFLRDVYNNIVYGRGSKGTTWGRAGRGNGNSFERHRVLAFKTADGWIDYNKKYGSGSPFNALMQQFDTMARQIAIARRFGHDADTGLDYMEQLSIKRARDLKLGKKETDKITGAAAHGVRMLRVMGGGLAPSGHYGAFWANFFSNTRNVLTAALLDRAVVISIPADLNSARMAAQAIGMNPGNFMSTYVGLIADSAKVGGGATKDFLARLGHIADSLANPGAVMSRWNEEGFASEWSSVLSNASMRVQGLQAHTDNLRNALMASWAGHFAELKDTAWSALPEVLRRDMAERSGITEADWDSFRTSGGIYTTPEGATFLDPIYWREANGMNDKDAAAELYMKMQGYVEKWTELAVPTGSLIAKGYMDPNAWGLSPGSFPFEMLKSAGMFKSFIGAFVVNQARIMAMTQSKWGGLATGRGAKAAYAFELVASYTAVGALAIQVGDMMMGRDPQDMSTDDFWVRAMLRGGGLGPVGDILSAGSTSWGTGFAGYAVGPMAQVIGDTLQLTAGNIFQAYSQAMDGKEIDVNFFEELMKMQSRYTPMWQTPGLAAGRAADALITEPLWMLLDPDAADAMADAAKRRANLFSNKSFWQPGSPLPTRLPNLGNAWSP